MSSDVRAFHSEASVNAGDIGRGRAKKKKIRTAVAPAGTLAGRQAFLRLAAVAAATWGGCRFRRGGARPRDSGVWAVFQVARVSMTSMRAPVAAHSSGAHSRRHSAIDSLHLVLILLNSLAFVLFSPPSPRGASERVARANGVGSWGNGAGRRSAAPLPVLLVAKGGDELLESLASVASRWSRHVGDGTPFWRSGGGLGRLSLPGFVSLNELSR